MRMTGKAFVCVVGLFVAEPLSAQVGPREFGVGKLLPNDCSGSVSVDVQEP